MDEYSHGHEHANLARRVEEACARLDSHLLEHEGLAVPHHAHTVGADLEAALADLAGKGSESEPESEPESSESDESIAEANEAKVESDLSRDEPAPPTVDELLPPEEGEPEGEPKRAHPLFHRVFGE